MPATIAKHEKMTAEAFLDFAATHGRCELIEGEVHPLSPASIRHGIVAGRLFAAIHGFVTARDLGVVTAAETGFVIDPVEQTVIAPDVAYIPKARLAMIDPSKFGTAAPDLAAEVLSPTDRATSVSRKVQAWLKFGVRLVLVVDPDTESVTAYDPTGRARVYQRGETLTCEPVLFGFELPLDKLFGHN